MSQNIICFPSVVWNHNWERQHEIIYRLAGQTSGKVYVHQPYGMINHSFGEILRKAKKIQEGSDQSSSFANKSLDNIQFIRSRFIPYHFFKPVDSLNASLIKVQTPLPYSGSIVFATYLNGFTLRLFKEGKVKILDLAQRRQHIDQLSREAKQVEERAVKTADLVVTDSISTKRDYAHLRSDIIHLPTGVDISRFKDTYAIPALEELHQQWETIAGYAGTDIALDKEALEHMINTFPKVLFLLIGEFHRPEILELDKYPNVIMPGRIHSRDIPSWCNGFDIGLIPYTINNRNLGIFPTKFFEYLASGIPVLSSALPDVIAIANKAVRVYEQHDAIPENFRELLQIKGKELSKEARYLAEQYSWDNVFKKYYDHIKEVLK